eukprot:363284-Chlamydomonas_euryale.AAC.8
MDSPRMFTWLNHTGADKLQSQTQSYRDGPTKGMPVLSGAWQRGSSSRQGAGCVLHVCRKPVKGLETAHPKISQQRVFPARQVVTRVQHTSRQSLHTNDPTLAGQACARTSPTMQHSVCTAAVGR